MALVLAGAVVVGEDGAGVFGAEEEVGDGVVGDVVGDVVEEPDPPLPEPPLAPPADPPPGPAAAGRGASTPFAGWVWKANTPAKPASVAPSSTGARLTASLRSGTGPNTARQGAQ